MKFLFIFCFTLFLATSPSYAQNKVAAASGDDASNDLTSYQRVSMYLGHSLFKAEPITRQSEMLWGIKGIQPSLEIAEDLEDQFDKARIEAKMLEVLKEKSIPIDLQNGHILLFRIRGVWDKDEVTLLYSYDLDLVDKVYVSRGGQIKSNFRSVWNVSNMGYAGKDVFENAMLINVESAIDRFAISFYEQLDYDIISDVPRQAKSTYQKIRDGHVDILKLLANQELEY